jgi:hypothetical protein
MVVPERTFRKQHSQTTICLISNRKANLSTLQVMRNRAFQFAYIACPALQLSKRLSLRAWQFHPCKEKCWHFSYPDVESSYRAMPLDPSLPR